MNFPMDDFSGFIHLEEKKNKVRSIISQYDFSSVIYAAFAITSWRNNRGAQESCLAINAAIADNEVWGNKIINTYEDLTAFFNLLYPIIQITSYDDPVLIDFGEVRLNYQSHYYSVITGTGHTVPVFAVLQFLELLSESADVDIFTRELLDYSDNMIRRLYDNNASIDADYSMAPRIECPSLDYYETVIAFFQEKTWESLNPILLEMLSTDSNAIIKSHFYLHRGAYYPLFNPSLIVDYFTNILSNYPQDKKSKIIKKALSMKLKKIYGGDRVSANLIISNCLLFNGRKPLTKKNACFVAVEERNLIIFLDCNTDYHQVIKEIQSAFDDGSLSVVDLDERVSNLFCKAYHIEKDIDLHIICYDDYINIDELRIKSISKEERIVYSPIDLMFMIMFSENIMQIIEFEADSKKRNALVFSWGGASDYYTIFLHQKGYISKGAIEYNNIYSGIDTAAAYIFSVYLDLNKSFPFHLSSECFNAPECWNIVNDDNNVNQFTKKAKDCIGGALFVLGNGCAVFLSYDFYTILKNNSFEQLKLSLDFFRGIAERFFTEFDKELSTVSFLNNTYLQLCCHSLSTQDDSNYIIHRDFLTQGNHITVDFEVNCEKLMNDISVASDRKIEYRMILELLEPIIRISEMEFSKLLEKVNVESTKKKTVDTATIRIDYFFNPNTYEIKETDVSQLSARKQIARICANAEVTPGIYTKKEATTVVRKIQEKVVRCLEKKIIPFSRNSMHNYLLSALSSELFAINVNNKSANLCAELDERQREDSQEKSFQASQKSKNLKIGFLYLLETNLFLGQDRGEKEIDEGILPELLSFAQWLVYLQNSSDLCFHTDSQTKLVVLDDYRIDVELGEKYSIHFNSNNRRRLYTAPYNVKGDETDREYFEKVAKAFYQDTGVKFRVLESVLHQLSESSFSSDSVRFEEILPNVIKINVLDVIKDFASFVVEDICVDDVKKAFDFLTINTDRLKSIGDKEHPILPIWEREKRDNCLAVKPLYRSGTDYYYSPIMVEELRNRWTSGFLQFYPPYEVGLKKTVKVLADWKNYYEHLFSSDVEKLLKSFGCDYYKHDIDIRREDRMGNHPTIDELGDYDVIGLSISQKRIYIIECKVLQPIGTIFEHSNQQKRFFFEEKYDEKFQKRIDYFSSVALSFFSNLGYKITKEFQIQPYMVVNKVFSSYYKDVSFPIVTYDELKTELENYEEISGG